MAEIHTIGPKPKFVVARRKHAVPEYLALHPAAGPGVYRWGVDPKQAKHFDVEKDAEALALRVAGGAEVAEVIVA